MADIHSIGGNEIVPRQVAPQAVAGKADANGSYAALAAGSASALTGGAGIDAALPRTSVSDGVAQVQSVKGNTVVWNQLIGSDTSSVTVESGHKYLAVISGSASIATSDGTAVSVTGGTDQLFDLTQMFGAGNEPSTVAEFEQMFPESYYAYSAPTLKPVSMTGIATTDADGNALDERSIPVSTYFPTGMKKAGSACDALYEDHADTVIGAVDLGTLDWMLGSPGVFISSTIAGMIAYGSNTIRCSKYETSPIQTSLSPDKTIYQRNYATVGIKDSSYTDVAAFKTDMSGVLLYFELATPTTQTIDPPLNLTYRTAEGGTESIVTAEGVISAPVTLTVSQGHTQEGVRDLALSAIAPVENHKASANYAVGSYLVHDGTLYKVTSAIAVGESITPNTNVTATTVMAELAAINA